MQGHLPSSIRIDQLPFNATLILNHMPHPPELANPGIPDKAEAVRQANQAASKICQREVDGAMLLVRTFMR